jgi:predicted Rossmann-fold nucleotide-binding protein
LLNVARYFDPLLALFDHAAAEGFLRTGNRDLVLVRDTPGTLLDALAEWPVREPWRGPGAAGLGT